MENTQIKPALTEQEWMVVNLRRANKPIGGKVRAYVDVDEWSEEIRHASAAQCLYGLPEGFTREDVWLLRGLYLSRADDSQQRDLLANRIEALLPPEK